jgi:hypothetical protein
MKTVRLFPAAALVAVSLAACSGPSRSELQVVNATRADSIISLRNELLQEVTEGSMFVAEVHKELAKARSLATRQIQPVSEVSDVTEDRKAALQRITQLVTRLESLQGRIAGMRTQLTEKDSVLAARVSEYEELVSQTNAAAERQKVDLQNTIVAQTATIAALSRQVDTLNGALGRLDSEHHAVYYVAGTRAELAEKGVLVPEGRKRFVVAGRKSLVPARDLDPGVFTRLDRRNDTSIVLPDGGYKIVSHQNGHYVIPASMQDGKIVGGFTIDQPERFWNTSRYLILVRS